MFYTTTRYISELKATQIAFFHSKDLQNYSFIQFVRVNVPELWEVVLNHCGCS